MREREISGEQKRDFYKSVNNLVYIDHLSPTTKKEKEKEFIFWVSEFLSFWISEFLSFWVFDLSLFSFSFSFAKSLSRVWVMDKEDLRYTVDMPIIKKVLSETEMTRSQENRATRLYGTVGEMIAALNDMASRAKEESRMERFFFVPKDLWLSQFF